MLRDNRSVAVAATLRRAFRELPSYRASVRRLAGLIRDTGPDLVINFFEPLTGLLQLWHRCSVPVLAVAHQFMARHPDAVRLPGSPLDRLGLRLFTRLVGARSWNLALSFFPAADLPDRRLFVGPPLLRRELFELAPRPGNYYLAYLLNHGYRDEVVAWQRQHSDMVLHCFYDRPEAPEVEQVSTNLFFHRINAQRFLQLMAGCRAVVSTAGFESVCEAVWLGKPVFLVPVANHVEQRQNAHEAVQLGFGISASGFALDGLGELPAALDSSDFREWVAQAEPNLERVIREVVSGPRRAAVPFPSMEAAPGKLR